MSLVIYRYGEGETFVLQDVLVTEPVEDGLIELNLDFSTLEADGRVVLNGLFFDVGEDSLLPTSKKSMNKIAEFLKKDPRQKYYVVGHTDSDGTHELNMNLSRRRAETVVHALQDQFGISTDQLFPIGNGATSPIVANHGESAKAKNRRVELVER